MLSAGGTRTTLNLSNEEWNLLFKINVSGAWLCSKYTGIHMRDAGTGGSIINISSVDGLNRIKGPGRLAYTSSKTALHAMTTQMAVELGTHNIRVNAVAPSIFRSEITEGLYAKKWLQDVFDNQVPLPFYYEARVDPSLTELIRYLIHPASKYVTGNIFIVDGGNTLAGIPVWSSL